jgi:hypothetical protein
MKYVEQLEQALETRDAELKELRAQLRVARAQAKVQTGVLLRDGKVTGGSSKRDLIDHDYWRGVQQWTAGPWKHTITLTGMSGTLEVSPKEFSAITEKFDKAGEVKVGLVLLD